MRTEWSLDPLANKPPSRLYLIAVTGARCASKDLMRLKNSALWSIAERMTIYILPVEVSFRDKENEFNELILKYVRTNRFHHQKYS